MPLANYGCLALWDFVVRRKWSSEKWVLVSSWRAFLCALRLLCDLHTHTHLNRHALTHSNYQCIRLWPHTLIKHTYKGTTNLVIAHPSAESARTAFFTSRALALCLHPNIAHMSLAYDVWCFNLLANANISVIKTITERDLQAMAQTHGREIAGGLLL